MNISLFVQYTRNGEECFASYRGQTQETVTSLLTELGGSDIRFLDQATFESRTTN